MNPGELLSGGLPWERVPVGTIEFRTVFQPAMALCYHLEVKFLPNGGHITFIRGHEIIILHAKLWVTVDDALFQRQRTEGLVTGVRLLAPSDLSTLLPCGCGKEVRHYCHFTDVMTEHPRWEGDSLQSLCSGRTTTSIQVFHCLRLFYPSDGLREYGFVRDVLPDQRNESLTVEF